MTHDLLRATVREILERPHAHGPWRLQGFGSFLRLQLRGNTVLHVWNPAEQVVDVPGMNTHHTHPWHMYSYVVSGAITQLVYDEVPEDAAGADGPYVETVIDRIGGRRVGESRSVYLAARPPRRYAAGESYEQTIDELHKSRAEPGAVTLVSTPPGERATSIRLFLEGEAWTIRTPRDATADEVDRFTGLALSIWGDRPAERGVR